MVENTNKSQDTTNKWVIKDYSKAEAERVSKVQQKQNVKKQIENNINLAIENANKKIPEYTLPKMKQFFSLTKNEKTILVLRYGSKIFYKGIIDDVIISSLSNNSYSNNPDNFIAKKAILQNCLEMLKNEKWFDENYKKYEAAKNESMKKAKKTRAENKKNNTTNKKSKAKSKTTESETKSAE